MIRYSQDNVIEKLDRNLENKKPDKHIIFSELRLSQIESNDQNSWTLDEHGLQKLKDLSNLTQSWVLSQTVNSKNSKTIRCMSFDFLAVRNTKYCHFSLFY